MAYSEKIATRIREAFSDLRNVEEKKMFRGMCFMVNGKMCVCVNEDEIMCRIDPAIYEEMLEHDGCRAMIHNGKTMKGFVYVSEDVLKSKKNLDHWLDLALEYNKKAKAAKKKTTAKAKSAK
jgi:TfoX/Sxy family transcriptional regulator of competence genes